MKPKQFGPLQNLEYRLFFTRLTFFLAILFLLDFSIGSILRFFYFKQESGLQYRTTFAIEKTTAEILIFGSSRANHHYHPDTFEKITGMTYYNVGRDGNFIFYHCAVLKSILARHNPKLVILDIGREEFKEDQESYDRLSSLLPYYSSHPEMRPIIELKSPYERLKLMSSIYPYNSAVFTIAIGNTEFNKHRKNDIKGYIPLQGIWNKKLKKLKQTENDLLDRKKIDALRSFIADCKKSGTKLILVCSPYFSRIDGKDTSLLLIQKIAKENKVVFLDYSDDKFYNQQRELFADPNHLNDSGAKIFSEKLLKEIW